MAFPKLTAKISATSTLDSSDEEKTPAAYINSFDLEPQGPQLNILDDMDLEG